MNRLLFIDDDNKIQDTVAMVLDGRYEVIAAYTGAEGIAKIQREDPDVVLLDINLPDIDGIEVLKQISAIPAPPPVVMLTAYSDIRLVVDAVKAGACDYMVKPFVLHELLAVLKNAVTERSAPNISHPALERMMGESRSIREVKELMLRYAGSASVVLIQGESGTGKELAARAMHDLSGRKGDFVAINCGAIPEPLMESELFGTERGAYTDASTRPGAFERANGGTLLLDEIADMPFATQVKLLRVLEERQIVRLGGTRAIEVDLRILAATNRDIQQEVSAKRFREDLYYRLSVLPIRLPPLRERTEDIPLLCVSLIRELAGKDRALDPEAIAKLQNHPWPGNVRELRNVMERALILSEGAVLRARDIRYEMHGG